MTTITRIVGVIPAAVWMLVGGLSLLVLALGLRSRLAASRARRLQRQRSELLEDVGLLQGALLPELPTRVGPVATSASYRPAAGPGAGGDFYDVFALEDGKLGVIVGDISGHGRSALPHTALVRFTMRAYLEAGLSPRAALQTAGAVLDHQLGDSFATVVAATYDPRERILVYACAGHPHPVILSGLSQSPRLAAVLASSAPPLGIGRRTGTRQTVVSLPGASQVCFHTDGVTESRVGSELFGRERLAGALAQVGPRGDARALLDRVGEQIDSRPDDMAACILGIEGGKQTPRVMLEELELDREEAASERTGRFLIACGVEPEDAIEVMRAAREGAEREGKVVLELRPSGGHTEISIHRDNLQYIQAHSAARNADLGLGR